MRHTSSLLPQALSCIGSEQKFTVLDLGPPSPASVRFFNRFRCRLYFADLLDHADDEPEDIGSRLDFPSDTRFDVCLFWDVLNYLDGDAVRAVTASLTGHLDENSRGHAFLAFSRVAPFSGYRFGIEEVDLVVGEPDPLPVPHVQTWKNIEDLMWPWIPSSTTLMQDNRQELLLLKELH